VKPLSPVRLGIAAFAVTAAALIVGPVAADALRPTSGEVEVTFDSCGRASFAFDGDTWNEDGGQRRDLAGQRLPGRFSMSDTSDGGRGAVVVRIPQRDPLRVDGLVRNGFVTLIGCI
jgi:hypothetical protein